MKFYIRKTSGENPPCSEAFGNEEEGYHIEIKTIEELMILVEKYGEIVLSGQSYIAYQGCKIPEPEIEIYDDYRG